MPCISNRLARLLVALLVAVLAAGCSGNSESGRVETTIREYNRQLARAFAQNDMNALSSVATHDQAYTEFYQMAALGEAGFVLKTTLQEIEFTSISFSGDASATAETTESWDYEHVSIETSETVRSEKGVTYRLRYELVLQDDRWLVDKVTSLEDETVNDSGGD